MLGRQDEMSFTLEDIKDMDKETYEELKALEEMDEEDIDSLEFTFQTTKEIIGGPPIDTPLKPGGAQITLCKANVKEFIQLKVRHNFYHSIEKQLRAFQEGFYLIIPARIAAIFTEDEIFSLLCGDKNIEISTDWALWGVKPEMMVLWAKELRWLAEVISEYTPEEKQKHLMFQMGQKRIPRGGWANSGAKLTFKPHATDSLPSACTCGKELKLPHYTSKEMLKKQLMTALYNFEGFAFS
eukprot:TRINITY_DN4120_c0_g1_i3.p1 TRINITY_DN4120_c0_g1~~TRINITY_DN4120_c0_g1_i3.p1  ORF type:complete len:240 (-),score=48.35 TRINITY_DN4120_c0_g1_i3:59-778(-)